MMKFTCNYTHYTPNETGIFDVQAKDFNEAKDICINELQRIHNGFFDFAIDDFSITDESGKTIWDK